MYLNLFLMLAASGMTLLLILGAAVAAGERDKPLAGTWEGTAEQGRWCQPESRLKSIRRVPDSTARGEIL